MYYLLLILPLSECYRIRTSLLDMSDPSLSKMASNPTHSPILPESFCHPVPGMTVVHNNQIPSLFPQRLYRKIFRCHNQNFLPDKHWYALFHPSERTSTHIYLLPDRNPGTPTYSPIRLCFLQGR